MTDLPLFILGVERRWRLAYDGNQWIVQRKKGSARPANGSGIADSGWRGVSFVGGTKATLDRLFREKVINLTAEAQARFDRLPEQFMDFIAAPESFARPAHAFITTSSVEWRQKCAERTARGVKAGMPLGT